MHLGGMSQIESVSLATGFSAFRHRLAQARPGKMAPFGVPLVILILGCWQEQVESSDRLVVWELDMSLLRHLLALLLAVTGAQSHAGLFEDPGMGADCLKYYSKAWCVLNAANMSKDLHDMSRDSFVKEAGIGSNGLVDLAMLGATAGGAFKTTFGLTRGIDVGMRFVNFLLSGKPAVVGQSRALAWMPKELATSSEEARVLFSEMVLKATIESFDGYEVSDNIAPLRLKSDPYTIWRNEYRAFGLKGRDCETTRCSLVKHNFVGTPAIGKAPKWLGGYDAWVFERHAAPSLLDLRVGDEYITKQYVGVLSGKLPQWVFLQITPETMFADGTPVNRGLKMPLIYNNGRAHAMVFPEIEFTESKVEAGR